MARSSQAEKTRRINAAQQLLAEDMDFSKAAELLSRRFGVSSRQAYRYLDAAFELSAPLPLPEPKDVFTVKLPKSLIDQLRRHPRPAGQSLSEFVCQALRRALRKSRHRGCSD